MCWTTSKKENAVPKVSDGNVKCRKVCCKRTSDSKAGITSWYAGFGYDTGKTYRTEMQHPAKLPKFGECYAIRAGFHSYSENVELPLTESENDTHLRIDAVHEGCIIGTMLAYPDWIIPAILECHIPEGFAYCENEYGEIVSEAITVDGITIMDGQNEKL